MKLVELFNKKENGFYIELGANTGLNVSNTALLEAKYNWTGILIEPSTWGCEECKKNRPNNIILQYACVSNDFESSVVDGDFVDGHPMASIGQTRRTTDNNGNPPRHETVPATTLEKILDEHLSGNKQIDFLSLDTEGYEYNILKGMNLKKYSPTYVLIEIYIDDFKKIVELMLSNNYILHSCITNFNHIDNPIWDGTCNDYLFIKL